MLNRRVAEVNALYEAGLVLSRSHNVNTLLTKIIELALEVIGATVGSVMLLDESGKELVISAAVGVSDEVRKSTRVKLGDSIAGYVAQSGEALLVICTGIPCGDPVGKPCWPVKLKDGGFATRILETGVTVRFTVIVIGVAADP